MCYELKIRFAQFAKFVSFRQKFVFNDTMVTWSEVELQKAYHTVQIYFDTYENSPDHHKILMATVGLFLIKRYIIFLAKDLASS